jgi:hypothetical protein
MFHLTEDDYQGIRVAGGGGRVEMSKETLIKGGQIVLYALIIVIGKEGMW